MWIQTAVAALGSATSVQVWKNPLGFIFTSLFKTAKWTIVCEYTKLLTVPIQNLRLSDTQTVTTGWISTGPYLSPKLLLLCLSTGHNQELQTPLRSGRFLCRQKGACQMHHSNGEDSQEYHYEIRSLAAIKEALQNAEAETVPGCRSSLKQGNRSRTLQK